jgi:hypothetical protein
MFVQTEQTEARTCGSCGRRKPVTDFAWRRKARGQRDNYCRPCRAAYKRQLLLCAPRALSPMPCSASEPSLRSAPQSSWRSFASDRASTAARSIRSCSSSTISATRASTSPKASAIQLGVGARRDPQVRDRLCKLSSATNRSTWRVRARGGSSMVEPRPSKAMMRVRSPSAASSAASKAVAPIPAGLRSTAAPRWAPRPTRQPGPAAATARTSCRGLRRA